MPTSPQSGSGSRSAPERRAGDSLYTRLRSLIVGGKLAPGSRLVEADIAQRLGVSRTPVRTALIKLQQEGYVVSLGNGRQSRLAVAPLTAEDARELYWIVGEVEGLAARWGAEQEDERREPLVAALRELNREFLEAGSADEPDPNALFELDAAFHRRYVEAGAGPRLRKLHDSLKPQTERYWRLYTSALVGRTASSVAEHDDIIAAFAAADPDAAADAVRSNWQNGADRLRRVIETLGERGNW
ncbi:MAG: GntR family transcriptional regulator [Gemmatimonadota bacterium]